MKSHRQRKSVNSQRPPSQDDYQAEDAAAISKFFRSGASRRVPVRKTFQLCRQVAETLNSLLSGECRDAVLQLLYVESVTPAPDATQLLVTVQLQNAQCTVAEAEILARLHRASGWFRTEVAAAITRRKAPQLVFQVHPIAATASRANREEGQP